MSELKDLINNAISNNKSIWIDEDDVNSHHINIQDQSVVVIDGKGCEYVQVTTKGGINLYNLSKMKSIKIDT